MKKSYTYIISFFLALSDFNDVYLATPLMGADLNNIVKTQRLSDDHVQFLVYQILRGMKYVHSAGIIHRVSNYSKDYSTYIIDIFLGGNVIVIIFTM